MRVLGPRGFSLGRNTGVGDTSCVILFSLSVLKRLARVCLGLRARLNLIVYIKMPRSGCAARLKAKCLVTNYTNI